jgi:uncharacterized OsmC-like protein
MDMKRSNAGPAPQGLDDALRRARAALERRPHLGLHDDTPATARWDLRTRVVTRHPGGAEIPTDMPAELGGTGDQVTPGWLFRAGFASCLATSIAMAAALEGIVLTRLEVRASSRSDARGALGMNEPDGTPVYGGPTDVALHVRVAARDVTRARLRALVDDVYRRSPVPCAVVNAVPVDVDVDVDVDIDVDIDVS